MTKAIEEIEKDIVDEFGFFESWMDKYNYIIELGKSLPPLDEQFKKEDYLVRGCQSRVWLRAIPEADRLRFEADSDAVIVKGLIAILLRVLSGQKTEDIIQSNLRFIDQIGLKEHLSPTRSNGLVAMIKKMKYYGIAQQSRQKA